MKVKLFWGASSNCTDKEINKFIEEGGHKLIGASVAAENGLIHAMITYISAEEIEAQEWEKQIKAEGAFK